MQLATRTRQPCLLVARALAALLVCRPPSTGRPACHSLSCPLLSFSAADAAWTDVATRPAAPRRPHPVHGRIPCLPWLVKPPRASPGSLPAHVGCRARARLVWRRRQRRFCSLPPGCCWTLFGSRRHFCMRTSHSLLCLPACKLPGARRLMKPTVQVYNLPWVSVPPPVPPPVTLSCLAILDRGDSFVRCPSRFPAIPGRCNIGRGRLEAL